MVKGPKPGYDERPDRYLKYLYWQLIVEKALAAGLWGRIACPTKEGKEGQKHDMLLYYTMRSDLSFLTHDV